MPVPVRDGAHANVECKIVERGDHHFFNGEVIGANLVKVPEGRAAAALLEMKEMGDNVFYGVCALPQFVTARTELSTRSLVRRRLHTQSKCVCVTHLEESSTNYVPTK